MVLDRILADGAGDRRRDRRGEDPPCNVLVLGLDAAAAERREPGAQVPHDIGPEVDDDGDERSEMEGDVEGLVEVGVRLQVVPVRDPWDEDQVARGGDRQQLGQALRRAEGESLPVAEPPRSLADVHRSEQRCREQQQRGNGVDQARADTAPRLAERKGFRAHELTLPRTRSELDPGGGTCHGGGRVGAEPDHPDYWDV